MRPMLAATCDDMTQLRYPLYASIKLDGIRAIGVGRVAYSRSWKPIPNRLIQSQFADGKMDGYDGELIVGHPADADCYRKSVSVVMSYDKPITGLKFRVFDNALAEGAWLDRIATVQQQSAFMMRHGHDLIDNPDDLQAYEQDAVQNGHEGIITRDPAGLYKNGRSTLNEQWLCKIKRFLDSEATVIGVEERMHNGNEATVDERGFTKRSSHKANQHPTGTLGALIVTWEGHTFKIGTGFNELERQQLWQKDLTGRTAKFKYLPIGMKDAPRHPVFLGWRRD